MQKMLAVASLCGAIAFLHPGEAGAQCAAKDGLQYVVAPRSGTAAVPPAEAVRKVWKTITLGRFANTFALRNALDAAGCGIGDLAEQILARPAFAMNPAEDVDLVVVSAAELGTPTELHWWTFTRALKSAASHLRRPRLVRSCGCNILTNRLANFFTSE